MKTIGKNQIPGAGGHWSRATQTEAGEFNARFAREEAIMIQLNPTKQQVREYLERRQTEHKPPPTLNEIRKQLGWNLSEAARHKNGLR